MGKAPAGQFYFADWLRDKALHLAKLSTQGAWMNILAYMWDGQDRGALRGSFEQIAKLAQANKEEMEQFIIDANKYKFCDISVSDNNEITLINRRMVRDQEDKENNRIRQRRFKLSHQDNEKITEKKRKNNTVSSSSSSNNNINIIINELLEQLKIDTLWDEFKKHRNKLKHPMTKHAEELILKKLLTFKSQGYDPTDLINKTIESGWQDINLEWINNKYKTGKTEKLFDPRQDWNICRDCKQPSDHLVSGLCQNCQ